MRMSDSPLLQPTLEKIHEEVLEYMKRNGAFDDIRVRLSEPIWSDENFLNIIGRFTHECELFCRQVDLTKSRNVLRVMLAERFEKSSSSTNMIQEHINKVLKEKEKDLKKDYDKHAIEFLKKFIPSSSPSDPGPEDMDLGSDDDIPPPEFSPIGDVHGFDDDPKDDELKEDKIEIDKVIEDEFKVDDTRMDKSDDDKNSLDYEDTRGDSDGAHTRMEDDGDHKGKGGENLEIQTVEDIKLEAVEDTKVEAETEEATDKCDEDKNDIDDELTLTFSDVSSVHTGDLSDFESSIELSDDEADLVGKPKKSKVSVDKLQEKIDSLKNNQRPPRNRKSNPRYSSEEFRLL